MGIKSYSLRSSFFSIDFHLNTWYLCLPTRTDSRNHFPGWVTLHTLILIFRLLQKNCWEYKDYQMKINFRTLETSARILWWRSPISPIKLIKNVLETMPLQFSFPALLFLSDNVRPKSSVIHTYVYLILNKYFPHSTI